jgi:hypothetical protein
MIKSGKDNTFICKELIQMALVNETTDNVTVLLVTFLPLVDMKKRAEKTEKTKKRKVDK